MIIGIDPGSSSGGIAMIDELNRAAAWKMPETETDVMDLLESFVDHGSTCYIEKVHSMPKQGVASTFTFGKNYGFLLGVLRALKIRTEHVTPQAWQKFLGCRSGGNKNITKAKAQELFPELKITHAIADALLIAEYGRRVSV